MRTIIFMLSFFMLTAVQAGQFDGKYRLDMNWDCKTVGMDGGAIQIRGGKLHGVESTCLMKKPAKVRGMDAVLYDLQCSGEGETWSNRLMLIKQKGGILYIQDGFATQWKQDGFATQWKHCPR